MLSINDMRKLGILLISSFILTISIASAIPTKVYVYPSTVNAAVGKNFTVDIRVEGITDMAAWEVKIDYNKNILEYSTFTEGPFLKSGGATLSGNKKYDGSVALFSSFTNTNYHVSGSGTLVTVIFKVKSSGNSGLNINNDKTYLLDSKANKISISMTNGLFSIQRSVTTIPIRRVVTSRTITRQDVTSLIPVAVVIAVIIIFLIFVVLKFFSKKNLKKIKKGW